MFLLPTYPTTSQLRWPRQQKEQGAQSKGKRQRQGPERKKNARPDNLLPNTTFLKLNPSSELSVLQIVMIVPTFFVASPEFLLANDTRTALSRFVADRSPVWSALGSFSFPWADDGFGPWLNDMWMRFVEWLLQPHILAVLLAWAIAFTIVCTLILSLGFGPSGVGAGTLAAAFQSVAYGGFTPAGGLFATLTSIGMLGIMMPVAALGAAIIATIVALIVWASGAGR